MPVPRYVKPRYEREYYHCPICHKPYEYHEDFDRCYKCPTCLTRPERYFVLIPKEWCRDNALHRLYASPSGQPLDSIRSAAELFYAIELERDNSYDGKVDIGRFKHKHVKALRFNEFIKIWLQAMENNRQIKVSTKKSYRWIVERKLLPHFKNADMRGIGNLEVIKFINELKGSDQYRLNIMQVLRSIFIDANEWEGVAVPRFPGITVERKVNRILKDEQVNLLLKTRIPEHHIPIFSFLFYTGVREGEACGLHLPYIDFEKKTAIISLNYYHGELTSTKGKYERKVPLDLFVDLTPMLRGLYDNAVDKKGFVFLRPDDRPYDGRDLCRIWIRARKGITTLGLHKAARATYLSRVYELTKDHRYVQRIAGHRHFKTTELYLEDYDIEEKTFELIKGKRAKYDE